MPPIYHITHIDNLQSIKEQGLWCDSEVTHRALTPTNIAYRALKARRARRVVPVGKSRTLADYVPFYFSILTPMQYVIARATTAEIQGDEQDIIYLVSSTETILEHQLSWCFTDGHAVEELSTFFDRIEALGQLDWDTIRAREWYNTDADPDRKRRKQAEFLVYRFVPWACVREIVVSKSSLARRVNQLLKDAINRPWISTRPQWFYNKG